MILYTESNDHHLESHIENSSRVSVSVDYFLSSEIYSNLMIKPNKFEDSFIRELIESSHGKKTMLKFLRPNRSVYCYNCKNKYENLLLCPFCNCENFFWFNGDTYITSNSIKAINECVSILITSLDNIISGEKYQYLLIRPPGHHCISKANGFCLINNAFILSEYSVRKGFKKVLILDYDYHHGNSTESLVKGKKDRYFISIHAYGKGIYPGTGSVKGNRWNIKNIPLLIENSSDRNKFNDEYCLNLLNNKVVPWIKDFNPELIIVSNGLDSHKNDSFFGLNLSDEFYRITCEILKKFNVPLIYVLEGGYNPEIIKETSKVIIDELMKN